MATSTIRGIRVIKEASFGSLDATTLEPDSSIFDGSEVALDVDRASLQTVGDAPSNPRDETRGGFYREPPDPETITGHADGDHDGEPYPLRRGTLSLTMTLEGFGSADPDDCPLTWILDAGLGVGWAPAIAAEAAQAAAADQAFAVADDSGYVVGGLLSCTLAGSAAEYTSIVAKPGSNVIHHSPALSAEADAGNSTVRPMRTWVSSVGNALLGASLAFAIDGDGWRTLAFGCRPSSYKFSATGRRVQLTVELNCALIVDDHTTVALLGGAQISAPPFRSGGPVLHALGTAGVVITDAIDVDDGAYPRIPGRTTPNVNSWEATITNQLAEVAAGSSRSVLGMSEWEVVDRTAQVKVNIDPASALDGDFWARAKRGVMLGWGPGGAAGSGGCIYLPAGWQEDGSAKKRNVSGPRVTSDLTLAEGGWHGDAGTATAASNTAIRLGLVI